MNPQQNNQNIFSSEADNSYSTLTNLSEKQKSFQLSDTTFNPPDKLNPQNHLAD